MAAKLCKTTEEVREFAEELFSYVWKKHRFNCESFEKMFAEKLSLEIEETGAKKGSKFGGHIGNAVLCSQHLLREFCCYFFTRMGKDLIKCRELFHIFVYSVIFQWIRHRNDVFRKVIDAAAIIAEAILYCDKNENTAWDLSNGPEMFVAFFKYHLEAEFFESGGWKHLELHAFGDYIYLVILLQLSTNDMKLPYENFKYSCPMILLLKSSAVRFPIENSRTCSQCVTSSNRDICHFLYSDLLHEKLKRLSLDEDSVTDKLLQEIELAVKESKNEASLDDYVCRIVGKINVKEPTIGYGSEATEGQGETTYQMIRNVHKKMKKAKSKKAKEKLEPRENKGFSLL